MPLDPGPKIKSRKKSNPRGLAQAAAFYKKNTKKATVPRIMEANSMRGTFIVKSRVPKPTRPMDTTFGGTRKGKGATIYKSPSL